MKVMRKTTIKNLKWRWNKMSLEHLISKTIRLALWLSIALPASSQADLPNLYSSLTEKGIVASQNKKTTINNKDITADIYIDEFSNSIRYPFVIIDETLNGTEKTAVESYGGKYIVCKDDASKADSIISLISGTAINMNYSCTKKTDYAKTYSGAFDLIGRKISLTPKNNVYIDKNGRKNIYFSNKRY
jgi:hypothetical protein